jgi:hypothetical protein
MTMGGEFGTDGHSISGPGKNPGISRKDAGGQIEGGFLPLNREIQDGSYRTSSDGVHFSEKPTHLVSIGHKHDISLKLISPLSCESDCFSVMLKSKDSIRN